MKQKLFAKKEESSMEQDINDSAEKVKSELKQKGKVVLEWVLIVTYLVLVIYLVFKPLTEFVVMCENYIRLYILKYFIN